MTVKDKIKLSLRLMSNIKNIFTCFYLKIKLHIIRYLSVVAKHMSFVNC
jgi:hypothetical protein